MIFAKTLPLVLSGKKVQTLRLAYAGDRLVTGIRWHRSHGTTEVTRVETADGRCRWEVGKVYAVQPERCHAARGRVRCTYLREVLHPEAAATPEFARAEGFDTPEEFLTVWRDLHSQPDQRCWSIGFELVTPGGVVAPAAAPEAPPVEIIGPDGKIHYRRPTGHPDIAEALRTPGYSVRWPGLLWADVSAVPADGRANG